MGSWINLRFYAPNVDNVGNLSLTALVTLSSPWSITFINMTTDLKRSDFFLQRAEARLHIFIDRLGAELNAVLQGRKIDIITD